MKPATLVIANVAHEAATNYRGLPAPQRAKLPCAAAGEQIGRLMLMQIAQQGFPDDVFRALATLGGPENRREALCQMHAAREQQDEAVARAIG